MALSNAERQARYKARLKAAASAPPSIRELVIAFFRDHPDERGEGCTDELTAEQAADLAVGSLVTFRLELDHWQQLYPDADLAALKAMFEGIEPPPLKPRRRRT
jgi:hypothetical protein